MRASGWHEPGPPRSGGDLGATVVEYSLILAVLVVALLGALEALEGSSRAGVSNEFDCVSERPPPTTCQKRAVTTSTSTTISATTLTTQPVESTTTTESTSTTIASTTSTTSLPTTTTSTSTTVPGPASTAAQWDNLVGRDPPGSTWRVEARLTLRDGAGNPVGGRPVTVVVVDSDGNEVATATCTTGGPGSSYGQCALSVDIANRYTPVRLKVTAVGGIPSLAPPTQLSPEVRRP